MERRFPSNPLRLSRYQANFGQIRRSRSPFQAEFREHTYIPPTFPELVVRFRAGRNQESLADIVENWPISGQIC